MKHVKNRLLLLLFSFVCTTAIAQKETGPLVEKPWAAFWITVPAQPAQEYGVYRFRKSFELSAKPSQFVVHVSGDNRYKLYVNGTMVSLGPARGDLFHWYYETVDIAPLLQSGKNTVAAVVWNDGPFKPEAQISFRTAFILQGNSAAEKVINTDKSWKAARDDSYQPLMPRLIHTFYVAGPGETVDRRQAADWMNAGFNDAGWRNAQEIFHGLPKGVFEWTDGWMLVPRPIPQMELTVQRLSEVRKAEGVPVPSGFPKNKNPFTIPANTKATLLLDQGFLTNAYPTLIFSKGKDARISMGYNEALYIDEGAAKDWREQNQKGKRDEVEGKRFVGKGDSIISNGSNNQQYSPLWWRTYRYLQLKVETGTEPLVIEDLYSVFTGYPFRFNAKWNAGNPELSKILDVGWRTARLCAFETYMDCPYYEQLQYVGDTRIQALVSLYNSGDDRLMRHAINLIDYSRMAEGITLSRYPTENAQQIPPFSLWWIGMLHDYRMYRPDEAFIKSKLPGMRQVLHFFSTHQQGDGSLKNPPYWNFTDWAEDTGWYRGIAPMGKEGTSASLDLQLLWAYQLAAELERDLGMAAYATQYKGAAEQLKQTIQKKYWHLSKGLFADRAEKDLFSQHVNTLAILTGLVQGAEAKELAQKIMRDKTLAEATIYFKYYVHQALVKAGFGNDYLDWLDVWRKNLAMGMTTWAEISDINRTRSDCHAWGSHPNIELFRTVLGVDTDAPGFAKVKIAPHLGDLKNVSGEVPHPAGTIKVKYVVANGKTTAVVDLPKNLPAYLLWSGKRYELKAGQKNTISLPDQQRNL